jgi:spermidine/putrescine-binding protein
MNFKMIKRNYDKGLWSKQMVKVAVKKGVITKEEYKDITLEEYAN